MAAVADTSPLILLAKVNQLTLLPELYREVFVPPAVAMELRAKRDATSPELDRFISSARVQAPGNAAQVRILSVYLGMGEAETIALASEIPDAILVMDDAEGRRVAQRLGLPLTGLLGVLIEAKARRIVPAVNPLLDQLVVAGLWLSEAMRRRVLDAVGE
jgi:predicted nucleic acid-binding protein